MTAINAVRLRDRLHVFGDGAYYNADGVLGTVMCKAVAIPSYPGVVVGRGHALSTLMLAREFQRRCSTFDELIDQIEDVYPEALENFAPLMGEGALNQVFVGGWSDRLDRMEMIEIENGAWLDDGGAFKLKRLPSQFCLPGTENWDQGFARPPRSCEEADADIENFALTILELQREQKRVTPDRPDAVYVGGLAELVTVTRDSVTSKVLHRWKEDLIGEPICPLPVDWKAWRARRATPTANVDLTGLSRLQRERMEKKARKGTLRR